MKLSAISWCDFSGGDLNFVTGCTPASAGCAHCYARAIYARFGHDFTPKSHQDKLHRLYKAQFPEFSPKRGAPHKPSAFIVDTGDLFHPDVPDDFIALAFAMMVLRQDVTWLVLTKRPERIKQALWLMNGSLYPHIWLGVTVENQELAELRIPLLTENWSGHRFLSVEPMLNSVDLKPILQNNAIGWVICGSESGSQRRYFDPEWARDLYEQCRAVGVPFFGKQDSDLRPGKPLFIYGQQVHEFPF
ncbi:MAG: DUF5131 family protein [Anaerolineae bacterium]